MLRAADARLSRPVARGSISKAELFAKPDAAKLLAKELRKPGYKPDVLALGAVTDVYQPIERQYRITRSVLKVLSDFNHPVGITTKSARVLDDIDLIADMAKRDLIMVSMSVTSLDRDLARKLEPRASTPSNRLDAIKRLSDAGVPVAFSVAPIIPAITDHEIEAIIEAAAVAGARWVNWTLVRLPLEIKDLFVEWLVAHFPGKAKHAMSLISQCHGGIAYRSEWGKRMKGEGPYADMIRAPGGDGARGATASTSANTTSIARASPPRRSRTGSSSCSASNRNR